MKKKVLFVMNTMGRAGAEKALIAFLNHLSPEEYDITLQVLINRGEVYQEVPDHVKIQNKHPDCGSVLSTGGRFVLAKTVLKCFLSGGKGFTLLPYLFKNLICQIKKRAFHIDKLLWRIIAKGSKVPDIHYDLAVAYLEGASTYFVADCVSATKKVSFLHINYRDAGYTRALDLDAYEKIDRIFSVSNEAKESFLQIYPEYRDKVFLFRNMLDTEGIWANSRLPLPDSDPFMQSQAKYRLLTVGRLHYQKAYDIAIPVLRLLRNRGFDVDWFVLGEGPLQKELQKLIAANHLSGHFVLLGSHANPYPYYRLADLYVHATRYEGKSIAIEEAQTLHKAIVASDCTGNREQIVHDQNGYLLPLDINALADGIGFLLDHTDKRIAFEKASAGINLSHAEDFNCFLELLSPNGHKNVTMTPTGKEHNNGT